MKLINEKYDLPLGLLYFIEHRLEPFLKLTPILRSRNERTHVKREDRAVAQVVRYVPSNYTKRKPLCYRRLTDTRLTDETGVVFAFSRKYADDVSYLVVTADDRVELLLSCHLHKVGAVLFENVIGSLGVFTRNSTVASDLAKRLQHRILCDISGRKQLFYLVCTLCDKRQKQMLHRDVFVGHFLCL